MGAFEAMLGSYSEALHYIAQFFIYTLELIGILIIAIGSVKALTNAFSGMIKKQKRNIVIDLGRALALALEFKMGAEIINTVIVRDLSELLILAIVIAIRAILAVLIHWEIKMEKKDGGAE